MSRIQHPSTTHRLAKSTKVEPLKFSARPIGEVIITDDMEGKTKEVVVELDSLHI